MRPEIEHLLLLNWGKEHIGFNDHVRSIVGKHLTSDEQRELCGWLRHSEDYDLIMIIAGIMGADPQPEYFAALKDALKRNDPKIVKRAAIGLIDGRYPGYLDVLFSSREAQQALGDDFAFELSGRGSEFTSAMRSQFLSMFCQRFGKATPRLDAMTAPWFRMLAELAETNDEVAGILGRIWGGASALRQSQQIPAPAGHGSESACKSRADTENGRQEQGGRSARIGGAGVEGACQEGVKRTRCVRNSKHWSCSIGWGFPMTPRGSCTATARTSMPWLQ